MFEQQERETNKAFAAFRVYLEMGMDRSLLAVAGKLGKSVRLVERWSRKFDWPARVQAHAAHLADIERKTAEALAVKAGTDWAQRQEDHREEEWALRGELIEAGRKVLEKFKDGSRGATLGDVARALDLASKLGRVSSGLSLEPAEPPPAEDGAFLIQIEVALDKVYGPGPNAETLKGEVIDVQTVGESPTGTGGATVLPLKA